MKRNNRNYILEIDAGHQIIKKNSDIFLSVIACAKGCRGDHWTILNREMN